MVNQLSNRRDFLRQAGLAGIGLVWASRQGYAVADQRPNFMLIIGDDMTWWDCQPYGSNDVKTPNLQKLADQGLCLDRMFTGTAMCAPTRQQLYTGLFPIRNGAYPNHSRVYDGTRSVAHHLQALGYRTALINKQHYNPPESFPFEYLGGMQHDGGNGDEFDFNKIEEFITRNQQQPWLLVVCSNQPHTPYNRGNTSLYKPKDVRVPPNLVDCPETRKNLVKYYAEITYLDDQVGRCMDILKSSGQEDHTLLMFTSEQGNSFPYGKWTCYDAGLKTAFILRWPGRIKSGSRHDAMVQYVDVVPTLVEAAGGDPGKIDTGCPDAEGKRGFDGQSFLALLDGKDFKGRDFVYGQHTTRGIINGTGCYPIRSVRDRRYKYIWNPNYQATFNNAATNNVIFKAWKKLGETNPDASERAAFYQNRPEEELYDLRTDPYELHNLADDPKLVDIKAGLRKELNRWMKQQGDEGIATEMKALERQNAKSNNWKGVDE